MSAPVVRVGRCIGPGVRRNTTASEAGARASSPLTKSRYLPHFAKGSYVNSYMPVRSLGDLTLFYYCVMPDAWK